MIESSLTISHNLFLTDEHRSILKDGDGIQLVGVSCPIWAHKGSSSEPGVEVFSLYRIYVADQLSIKHQKDGYEITIPEKSKETEKLPDDIWDSLSKEEQDLWYANNEPEPCLRNLLSIKDGGSDWLAFRQLSKIKKSNRLLYLIHFIEMKNADLLAESLTI
jgi:hypothetical protein